ncbi:MAG TPA: YCF48-related protein [Rhodocyclaceae bacterium]|nr:YCF48-related protein [Rhodocyclaceae bacterium]
MKKTICNVATVSLFLISSLALSNSAPPPAAPFAMNHPALMSAKASDRVMLAVTHAGKRLVAAGGRGIILYSDDDGVHWIQATVPTSVTLTALRFVDDKRGWAVGHMGIVLHTTDGGKTWTKQLDGIEAAQLFYAQAQASGDEKALKHAKYLISDGPNKPLFDIVMDRKGRGLVVGAFNLALRTTDGGQHWQPWSSHIENPQGLNLYSIARTNDATYIVGEQGLILRSTDNGENFTALKSPYPGSWFGALTTNSGLLVYGLSGNAFFSATGGDSWQALQTGTTSTIDSATQLQDGRLLLVAQAGQLLIGAADRKFSVTALKSSVPLTAVLEDGNETLVLTSLRGLISLPVPKN